MSMWSGSGAYDVAGARVVGVELVDDLFELLLRHRGGQVATDRLDADLRAVAVLAGDVPLRSRIVADEDRPETGDDPPRSELTDLRPHLVLHLRGDGLAVEDLRGHQYCSRPS